MVYERNISPSSKTTWRCKQHFVMTLVVFLSPSYRRKSYLYGASGVENIHQKCWVSTKAKSAICSLNLEKILRIAFLLFVVCCLCQQCIKDHRIVLVIYEKQSLPSNRGIGKSLLLWKPSPSSLAARLFCMFFHSNVYQVEVPSFV